MNLAPVTAPVLHAPAMLHPRRHVAREATPVPVLADDSVRLSAGVALEALPGAAPVTAAAGTAISTVSCGLVPSALGVATAEVVSDLATALPSGPATSANPEAVSSGPRAPSRGGVDVASPVPVALAMDLPDPLPSPSAAQASGIAGAMPSAPASRASGIASASPSGGADATKAAAASLVKRFEVDTAPLYATSGFASRDELMAAVDGSTATAREAARLLVDEDLEIGMAVNPASRDAIAKGGFLNFRGSEASGGAVMGRETIEANYAGMSVDDYTALDANLKPRYAFVSPKPGSGLDEPVGVRSYGSDRFIFDLDKVRDRLTFTVGDSLNRHYNQTMGFDTPATTWDQRFTPWSRRELAAPAMAGGLDQHKMGLQMDVFRESLNSVQAEYPSLKYLIQLTDSPDPDTPVDWTALELGITPPPGTLEKYTVAWGASLDYVEVQMWGPYDLGDVKAFEFTENPPEGDFLKALRERGIEIRDGRQHPPTVWE